MITADMFSFGGSAQSYLCTLAPLVGAEWVEFTRKPETGSKERNYINVENRMKNHPARIGGSGNRPMTPRCGPPQTACPQTVHYNLTVHSPDLLKTNVSEVVSIGSIIIFHPSKL